MNAKAQRRSATLLLLVAVRAAPAQARLRETAAREFEAKKACASGHPQLGVDLLAAYYAKTGDPVAIYNQGRCYEQNAMGVEAVKRFREYLRVAGSLSADDRRDVERHISGIEGDAIIPATDRPAEIASPDDNRTTRWRTAGLGLSVVAVAALAGGVFSSVRVSALSDEVRAAGTRQPSLDYQTLQQKMADGSRYQTLQWVGYGAAAAASAGAVFCLLRARGGAPTESRIALYPVIGVGVGVGNGNGMSGGALHLAF